MLEIGNGKVAEPLRDIMGRALYEEPGCGYNWYDLSEDRREPWRKDADRALKSMAAFGWLAIDITHPALAEIDDVIRRISPGVAK